jgi:outer membrane biosynthesis protein TonB
MRTGLTISAISHAALLLWGIITFTGKPFTAESTESMPIDIISAKEFSQLTAGAKNAPKADTSKPLVDKAGEKKAADDPNAKLDKKEVTAAIEKPPTPEPKPPSTAENKPVEEKRDLIAEAIKRDQVKKPDQKKAEAKNPVPPKKEQPPSPKYDPRQVQALLDKRTPQRVEATGEAPNEQVSLGAPSGIAAQLSQTELDALRARLANLWNPPAGATNPEELVVQIRIRLNPDGRLAAPPQVLTSSTGKGPLFVAARDSAARAVFRGQPFDMLKPEHYDQWKDIEITFDPRDMIRG